MSLDAIMENNVGFTLTLRLFKMNENRQKEYLDVSGYDDYSVVFRSPSGTVTEVAGAVTTTGLDGRVSFNIIANTFDTHGQWRAWVRLVGPPPVDLLSKETKFQVGRRPTIP